MNDQTTEHEAVTLLDMVNCLAKLDPELTIYAKRNPEGMWTHLSPAIADYESNGYAPEHIARFGYQYFLEAFLAKEIIEDWYAILRREKGINITQTPSSLCDMLIFYAENDCYPEP